MTEALPIINVGAFLENLLDVAVQPLAVVTREVTRRDDDDGDRPPRVVPVELGDELEADGEERDLELQVHGDAIAIAAHLGQHRHE